MHKDKSMNITEFFEGIKLGNNHREAVLEMNFDKHECVSLCDLYKKNHKAFYEEVLKKEKSELWFLWLYSYMACNVYEQYQEMGIDDEIFWNTFLDISLWCENAKKEFGILGLKEYGWFFRHIDMVLFRLGRLQFEKMELEDSVVSEEMMLKEGTEVINVHIPQGEPLTWEACERSIEMAKEFWGEDKLYVCHSWLLFPDLDEILSESSNIKEFRKHFKVLQVDYREREAEWRIFGSVLKNVTDYPEATSLQRKAKKNLLQGGSFGNGWGILV